MKVRLVRRCRIPFPSTSWKPLQAELGDPPPPGDVAPASGDGDSTADGAFVQAKPERSRARAPDAHTFARCRTRLRLWATRCRTGFVARASTAVRACGAACGFLCSPRA